MRVFEKVGDASVGAVAAVVRMAAVSFAVGVQAVQAGAWRRTVRESLVEQIYVLGVRSTPLIGGVGFLAGTVVVAQYQSWVGRIIESRYLSMLVVIVIVRELAPLLVNILLMARGGASIATELGLMAALGEARALDAQGLDPMPYLLMPRVLGMLISAICLVLIFLAFAVWGVYAGGQWVGAKLTSPLELAGQIMLRLTPMDAVALAAKTCLSAWVGASVCCDEGLKVGREAVMVPRQTGSALQKSLIAVVFICSLISWMAYAVNRR